MSPHIDKITFRNTLSFRGKFNQYHAAQIMFNDAHFLPFPCVETQRRTKSQVQVVRRPQTWMRWRSLFLFRCSFLRSPVKLPIEVDRASKENRRKASNERGSPATRLAGRVSRPWRRNDQCRGDAVSTPPAPGTKHPTNSRARCQIEYSQENRKIIKSTCQCCDAHWRCHWCCVLVRHLGSHVSPFPTQRKTLIQLGEYFVWREGPATVSRKSWIILLYQAGVCSQARRQRLIVLHVPTLYRVGARFL